jgi:hypothetical protein
MYIIKLANGTEFKVEDGDLESTIFDLEITNQKFTKTRFSIDNIDLPPVVILDVPKLEILEGEK